MKYKKYPAYKDSGVEWLGEIPEHWSTHTLKRITDVQLSNIDKHSVEGQQAVQLCNYVDVYKNERITNDLPFMRASASDDQINRLSLKRGDVIITKDSETPDDIGVSALVDDEFEDVVCGYHLALLRPVASKAVGSYIHRTLQSSFLRSQFSIAATGMTRYGLGKYSIENAVLPHPPLDEQIAIARFIDRETDQIDTLIAKQERLIATLQEKRQALISHAVTKGLNPDVPMKESGVEWLGEVPEHWQVKKLKYLASKIGSGRTPRGGSEVYVDDGILFIRSQNVYDDGLRLDDVAYITSETDSEMSDTRVLSGDILLNITGASLGRTCIAPDEIPVANVNQHVCIIRIEQPEIRPFVSLAMKSLSIKSQIDVAQNGAAREGLNYTQIGMLTVGVPPSDEQEAIVDFVSQETAQIDTLIEKANAVIERLIERRTALISAAVTGKIDVRAAMN